MRHLLHLLPLLLLLVSCSEDTPEPVPPLPGKPDYFVAYWGDSKETIIQKEGDSYFENTDTRLSYYGYIDNVTNTYIFQNGRLTGAETNFQNTAETEYLTRYYEERRSMNARQGRIADEYEEWISEEERIKHVNATTAMLNQAIHEGKLRIVGKWVNDRTASELVVGHADFKTDSFIFRKSYRAR